MRVALTNPLTTQSEVVQERHSIPNPPKVGFRGARVEVGWAGLEDDHWGPFKRPEGAMKTLSRFVSALPWATFRFLADSHGWQVAVRGE